MRDSGATNQQTAVNRRDFVRAAGAMAAALTLEGFKETASADDGRSDGRRSNDRRDDAGRVQDFREVKGARLFDLCPTWDENSPIASVNPKFSMKLDATHANTFRNGQFDQHLADTASAQATELHRGDTVLIRTGWGPFFTSDPAKYAGASSPGPGVDGATFLIDHGARVVGNDTLTFEKRPPVRVVSPTDF